ncbi:MAG: hypothetical protein DRP85_08015 [Candidatus Makaraimicrobium thalassicum]|nr:MAG: hypothetical protein DRP85_08015 [Candidatus Omnitrophota bacterium]
MMEKKLPEGWEIVKLGDYSTIFNGKTPSKNQQRKKGHPILKIKDINENGCFIGKFDSFVDDEFFEKNNAKCLKNGDTLILNAAHNSEYVGSKKAYISEFWDNIIPTGEWLIIRSNSELLDNRFKHFLLTLNSFKVVIKSIVKGIHLYPNDMKILKIPLPPLETQRKIVAILEKADEAKRLRVQADELTSQLLQSVFLEMFGDPVKNTNGWGMVKLGDLGDWTSGGTPSRTKPEHFQGNIPWFTAGELNDSYLLNSKERITEEALEVSAAKIFPKETMLIGMYDTAAFKMGLLLHPASSNQACAAFILKKEEFDSLFALHLFKAMKPVFLSKRRGVRQKNLSQTIIKNFEVPLPPFSLQTEFRQIVEKVEAMRQNQKQSHQEIDNLFNALMQKAFKGELTT